MSNLPREGRAHDAAMTKGPWTRRQAQDGECLPDGTGYAGDWYDTNEIEQVMGDLTDEPTFVAEAASGPIADAIVWARNNLAALLDAAEERDRLRAMLRKTAQCLSSSTDILDGGCSDDSDIREARAIVAEALALTGEVPRG